MIVNICLYNVLWEKWLSFLKLPTLNEHFYSPNQFIGTGLVQLHKHHTKNFVIQVNFSVSKKKNETGIKNFK